GSGTRSARAHAVWCLASRYCAWRLGQVIPEWHGSVSPDRGSTAFYGTVRADCLAVRFVGWCPPRQGVGDTTQLPARYGRDGFCHLWSSYPALLAWHDAHRRVCGVARLAPIRRV